MGLELEKNELPQVGLELELPQVGLKLEKNELPHVGFELMSACVDVFCFFRECCIY